MTTGKQWVTETFSLDIYTTGIENCVVSWAIRLLTAIIKPIDWLFHLVVGHQLTTLVCPNFPVVKMCGCLNFNQCGRTSLKEIFGENIGLYPVKMIVL